MNLYGLGMAANALAKSLESLNEADLKTQLLLPEYQRSLAQAELEEERLREARELAPFRKMKLEEEAEILKAKRPYIGTLAQAEIQKKLGEAAKAGLDAQKLQTEINKLNAEFGQIGVTVKSDEKGNLFAVKFDPATQTVKTIAKAESPDTVLDRELNRLKLQREQAELNAILSGRVFDPAKQQELAETRRWHDIQEQHLKDLKQYRNDLLALKRNNDVLGMQKVLFKLKEDLINMGRADAQHLTVGPFGATGYPGEDINKKAQAQEYLIRRSAWQKAILFFQGLSDDPIKAASQMMQFTPDPEMEKYLSLSDAERTQLVPRPEPQAPFGTEPSSGILGLFGGERPKPMPTPLPPASVSPQAPQTSRTPVGQNPKVLQKLQQILGMDPHEAAKQALLAEGIAPTDQAIERMLEEAAREANVME